MRIVDLTNIYSDVGGGVRTFHRQKFDYFARHPEHSYALVAPGSENETVEYEGGRLHYVKGFAVSHRDSPKGYRIMYDVNRVRKIFRQEIPDVVEIGGPYTDPWFAKIAKLYCDPVFVGFYHLEFRDAHIEPWISRWPAWAQRATMRFFDWSLRFMYKQNMHATFVASKCVRDELAEIGVDNTILTPLGVDVDKFDAARRDEMLRASWGTGPDHRVLLHAGRLSVEKGTNVVLSAAERLLEDPRVHVVFAGRGPMTPQIEDLAAGHDRVHFMGYVSDPRHLGAIFASCDAYLGTGPYETFGLAILEALSSGLPVVATDQGAGPELVQNSRAGLLFRAGDSADLVEKVGELLGMDLGVLSHRARKFAVENGTWKRTFDLMYGHYSRLLAVHRGETVPRAFVPRYGDVRLEEPGLAGFAPAMVKSPVRAVAP
jgi:alpha-1,6-mannosyltransferase